MSQPRLQPSISRHRSERHVAGGEPIPEIIAELKAGRMVILVDEEDRENEGDLVIAADFITPDAVNFMAKHGRGLICLTLTESRCRQLNLAPMVSENRTVHGTAFTISIEAAEGVTTGISAADRAHTIRVAVRAGREAARHRPARSHLSGDGPAGRRARAGRPHRSRLRPDAARRPDARRGDLRDSQGRRLDGAPARPGRVRARPWPQDRCNHRPDPLSQPDRAADRTRRRTADPDRRRRVSGS